MRPSKASPAVRFVLLVGVMSPFADLTSARSIVGQYLGLLGAGAFAVGVVAGLGSVDVLGPLFLQVKEAQPSVLELPWVRAPTRTTSSGWWWVSA